MFARRAALAHHKSPSEASADAPDLVARVHDVVADKGLAVLERAERRQRVVDVRQLRLEPEQEHLEEPDEQVAAVGRREAAAVRLAHKVPQEHHERVGGHAARVRVVEAQLAQKRLEHEHERRQLRRLRQVLQDQVAREQACDVHEDLAKQGAQKAVVRSPIRVRLCSAAGGQTGRSATCGSQANEEPPGVPATPRAYAYFGAGRVVQQEGKERKRRTQRSVRAGGHPVLAAAFVP
eukprot:22982-Pleurochrysis_carterae.AAC.3